LRGNNSGIRELITHFGDTKPPIAEYYRGRGAAQNNFVAFNASENKMENSATQDVNSASPAPENRISETLKNQLDAEKKISNNILNVRLSPEGLIFKDADPMDSTNASSFQYTTDRLSGVYCQGVQYFDLSKVQYINNTGMATLIDLLKSLLEMGVEVQFVNVDDKIKNKIKEMGLDKIINCSGSNIEKRILL
jgi:anti-anti-sigma regulatory factor